MEKFFQLLITADFRKMDKLLNFITQVTEVNLEEKRSIFHFLYVGKWKITITVQKKGIIKTNCNIVLS